MQFSKIIGQDDVKKRLLKSVADNRVSHSQLFIGTEGSGKLALAIAYAQYISCHNRTATDSCGTCPSCNKYQKLIHPDLHFVFPVSKAKKTASPVSDSYLPEWRTFINQRPYRRLSEWLSYIGTDNQQGSIYVQESESIIRKLNLKTYEAEYKVMIIWMPEKFNTAGANKLLKIIEEPPSKTLFLLVTEKAEDILGTIISRSQPIKIPKLETQDLYNALVKDQTIDMPEANLHSVARLARGSYLNALDLIKQSDDNALNFDRFTHFMRLCYSAKVGELIKWVDEIALAGREKQKAFLEYALQMVRENFMLNLVREHANSLVYLANQELDFSRKFSAFIHKDNVHLINQELNKAHYHIERNAYGKLVFLDLGLKITKMLRIKKT